MTSMKWLRSLTDSLSTPKRKAPEPEVLNGTSADEAAEIDLGQRAVLENAVFNARHALVMAFRTQHRCDPSPVELADWLKPIWEDRERVRTIIQCNNAMALSLGERFPTFWDELGKAALK